MSTFSGRLNITLRWLKYPLNVIRGKDEPTGLQLTGLKIKKI